MKLAAACFSQGKKNKMEYDLMNIIPSEAGDVDGANDLIFLLNHGSPADPKMLPVNQLSHALLYGSGVLTHGEIEESIEETDGILDAHVASGNLHDSFDAKWHRSSGIWQVTGLAWNSGTGELTWTAYRYFLPLNNLSVTLQSGIVLSSVGDYGYIDLADADPSRPLAASPTSFALTKLSHIVFCRRTSGGVVYKNDNFIGN